MSTLALHNLFVLICLQTLPPTSLNRLQLTVLVYNTLLFYHTSSRDSVFVLKFTAFCPVVVKKKLNAAFKIESELFVRNKLKPWKIIYLCESETNTLRLYSLFLCSICVLDGHNLGTLCLLILGFLLGKNERELAIISLYSLQLTIRESRINSWQLHLTHKYRLHSKHYNWTSFQNIAPTFLSYSLQWSAL